MRKLRVMWLSNKVQTEQDSGETGTWLEAAAHGLIEAGEVELGNIARGNVAHLTRQDCGKLSQWIVPSVAEPSRRDGMPTAKYSAMVARAVNNFSPDIVHVWGTEGFWGLLTAKGIIQGTVLLEMQGLKGAIARVYDSGLSLPEQLACIGPKEIIRRNTTFQARQRFREWGVFEENIIAGHCYITVQSPWLEAQVRSVNAECEIFHNDFALRDEFSLAIPWRWSGRPTIYCSAAYPAPFKGLHVIIRAVALLKPRFPGIELRIAGALQRPGIRQDGYIAWLNREARRLGVAANIVWLGPLNARQVVSELQTCSAIALPTFIEAYCLALAEAMVVGTPVVASYVGGTASLARDEVSALFFSPNDDTACAYHLARLLSDRALAENLSAQARQVGLERNDRQRIVRKQIDIYRQVLDKEQPISRLVAPEASGAA